MKKLTYSLLFLLFPLLAFAQAKISLIAPTMDSLFYQKDSLPYVQGRLLNYTPSALALTYQLVVPVEGNQISKKVIVNPDGTFELKIPHAFPYQQIHLKLGTLYSGELILHQGLTLELDLAYLKARAIQFLGKGVQFGGPDAAINVYFNRFQTFQQSTKGKFYKAKQDLIMNSELALDQQLLQYDEVYKIWDHLLADYLNQYPSEYAWILQNERDSDYYAWLFTLFWQEKIPDHLLQKALLHQPLLVSTIGMTYYKYLCRLMKLMPPEQNYALTKSVLEERVTGTENLKELNRFLAQYQSRLQGQNYDTAIFQRGVTRFLNTNQEALKAARLDVFASNLGQLDARLADVLKLFGAPINQWKRKVYYKKFLPLTATNWVSSLMLEEIDVSENYTASFQTTLPAAATLTTNNTLGIPINTLPFDAALYLGQGKDAATFVASLQNAFPNKALILDVWATWCKPCIVDMEKSKAKKALLKKLPVEIIYLAISDGSSQQKWEQTINKLSVSGQHIYIEKDLTTALLKQFNLFGYPSYIFIDKDGNWDTNFVRSISNIDLDKIGAKL